MVVHERPLGLGIDGLRLVGLGHVYAHLCSGGPEPRNSIFFLQKARQIGESVLSCCQGCIRGEGGGRGVGRGRSPLFLWSPAYRTRGKFLPKRRGNFATEGPREMSPENGTENLWAGSCIGRGGGKRGGSYDCQAFQYVPGCCPAMCYWRPNCFSEVSLHTCSAPNSCFPRTYLFLRLL